MKNNVSKLSLLSVGAMALVLVGAGCAATTEEPHNDAMMEDSGSAMMEDSHSGDTMMAEDAMNADDSMVGGDAMVKDDGAMMDSGDAMMEDSSDGDAMMEKDGEAMMEEGDAMEKEDTAAMEQAAAGTFADYTDAAVAAAGDDTIVLAFFADWCSTCKAAKKDINAQLDEIPAGVTILDVDFDNSTALRQKYKVTTQHTFVQVDADGNMIKTWRGGNTLQSIVDQVS